jgi:hypothetical protein
MSFSNSKEAYCKSPHPCAVLDKVTQHIEHTLADFDNSRSASSETSIQHQVRRRRETKRSRDRMKTSETHNTDEFEGPSRLRGFDGVLVNSPPFSFNVSLLILLCHRSSHPLYLERLASCACKRETIWYVERALPLAHQSLACKTTSASA